MTDEEYLDYRKKKNDPETPLTNEYTSGSSSKLSKKKRMIIVGVVIAVVVIIIVIVLAVVLTKKKDKKDEQFAGGTGSADDPYQIDSCGQISLIKDSNLDMHYVLNQNIECGEVGENSEFEPIGTDLHPFNGTFNGNSKTITKLTYAQPSEGKDIAMFYTTSTNALIFDLNIYDINFQSDGYIAGLVVKNSGSISNIFVNGTITQEVGTKKMPCAGGIVAYNYGKVDSSISRVNIEGKVQAGGLICENYGTIVSNSKWYGTINGNESFNSSVGGLIAENHGIVTDCLVSGNINAFNASIASVGGLIGYNNGNFVDNSNHNSSQNTSVINCNSTITILGSVNVGGLIGNTETRYKNHTHRSEIYNCHSKATINTGDLNTTLNLGGLIGSAINASIHICSTSGTMTTSLTQTKFAYLSLGGIVGALSDSSISKSFSKMEIIGDNATEVGGVAGSLAQYNSIDNCYSMSTVSGNESVGGLIGYVFNINSIINSYAAGPVKGVAGDTTGGLIGSKAKENITISASFWDTTATGQISSQGGEGMATEEMQLKLNYPSWDFNIIWNITDGKTYPYFIWEEYDTNTDSN